MSDMVLPQIVAVGIYNAEVALKNRAVSKNRKTTMFELELPILEGGISYIDDEFHAISERLIISAKPGQMRHTRLPFKCYYIHMIVSEGHLFDVLSSLPNYLELANADEIKAIFLALCEAYDNGAPESELLLQSLILKLVYTLNRQALAQRTTHNPKRNNHEIIERTIEYINANPTADLSLAALCARVNFTPVYFHKLFRASTGKTLQKYVEEQRLKKAIALLLAENMTLAQIAYECGFSSQSYFNYAFKRKMKRTPREYAKEVQLQYENRD